MTAFSFSYAPKASSALASINPIQSRGEGLRFAANTPMSFIKQNPEIVTEGFWKGRQALTEGVVKGVTSALSGVSGALTQKAADAKADAKLKEDRAHEIAIANIKAAPTEAEKAYQQQRSDLLTQQIAAAKAKNENVTATESTGSLVPREVDFFSDLESIPDFEKQPVETPAPAGKPAADANSAPPTQPAAAPAAPPVAAAAPAPPAAAAPANVTSADPNTVFQTASTATPESIKNVLQGVLKEQVKANQNLETAVNNSRKKLYESANPSVAYEVKLLTETNNFPELEILAKNKFIDKNVLDEYKNIKSKQELITSRPQTTIPATPTANKSDVLQDLSFNDINITPSEQPQLLRGEGYQLPVVESEFPTTGLPESKGQLVLNGVSLPLEQVQGAEGVPVAKTPAKPLEGTTPPPVESALPQQVPTEPVEAKAVPFTQDQVRYYLEDKYTSRPYQSPADANMAKKLLEQKLGVKVEIDTEKGEKGTRLYHVRIVGDAPPPKTAPEGYFTESIRDANGQETYVYKPKLPVKQQIATFDNNIDKAKVLKKTLEKIEKIAPGYLFAGAGGVSGLMKYNPFANDAKTTRALLDTVKGIVGFDELVALKAQGGTLGALSDKELDMLTSLKGSINPDMDEATFLENIKSMRESTDRLIAGLEDDKKQVTNVEKQTNFQSIQTEKPKYKKGDSGLVNGVRYVYDGTKWNRQ